MRRRERERELLRRAKSPGFQIQLEFRTEPPFRRVLWCCLQVLPCIGGRVAQQDCLGALALPDFLRKGEGFGTPEDCAALVPFLASDAARSITGQAIGIGGDKVALWSHPQEIRAAYADGGWTPDTLADAWPTSVGAELQSVGIPAPKFPEA